MQEQIIHTVALSVLRKKYTEREKALGDQLTKPGAQVEVILPEDISPEDFDVALSAVSKVLVRAQLLGETMMPALGRLLFIAEQHPELWNQKFETFEAFRLSLADRFGVGRQTTYDALRYTKRWSAVLPPEDFKSVGRVKLGLVDKYVEKGKEGRSDARKLLDFAKTHTAEELEGHMVDKGYLTRGEQAGAKLSYPCNKRQAKDHVRWFKDPRVIAKVGSDKWADIEDMMIAECSAEWFAEGEELIESAAEAARQAAKDGIPADEAGAA